MTKYKAVFLLPYGAFLYLEMAHDHHKTMEEFDKDAYHLADRLGASYLYKEEME